MKIYKLLDDEYIEEDSFGYLIDKVPAIELLEAFKSLDTAAKQ